MPYARRRTYARRGRSGPYRRRRRRTYGRRPAPTVRRRAFRTRRRPGVGRQLASIPLTVRNNVLQSRVVPITFTDSITLYPEDDTTGGFGAASTCWRCSVPNTCVYSSTSMLGAIHHMDPTNTLGTNPMCANGFSRYEHFEVLKSQIQLVISPTGHYTEDSWSWVRTANCYLTLSDDTSPWNIGSSVASIDPESSIRNGRNVVAGRTVNSAMGGSTNKQCMLRGTYTPRRVFQTSGIDRGDFVGSTNSAYTAVPTLPTKQAFWNLLIMPGEGFPTAASGATFKRGVPYPQRVDVKITYMVRFTEPIVNIATYQAADNAPVV